MAKETCARCYWHRQQTPQTKVCKRFPATVFIMPSQSGVAGPKGEMQTSITSMSFFPPMAPNDGCGEFKPKFEKAETSDGLPHVPDQEM